MLCIKCGGTKKYLGNGMILSDCEPCTRKIDNTPLVSINRKSKSYLNAIKEIMEIHPGITKAEAVKLFEKTFAKV